MRALLLVPLLAGCELYFDEPDKTTAEEEPGVDPIESLVGRWRQVPSRATPNEPLAEIEFRSDGTYRGTDGSGMWREDSGSLTMTTEEHVYRQSYVLELGRLLLQPYRPANSNYGVHGSWTHSELRDEERLTHQILLRGDGTGTFVTPTEEFGGAWRISGDELSLATAVQGEIRWRFIGNMLAVGFPLYERVR